MGKYTVLPGLWKEDAPDFIYADKEQGISPFVFYVHKRSSWKFTGIESLKTLRVGVIKNYYYPEPLNQLIQENHPAIKTIAGNEPLRRNLIKLVNSRIDTLAEDMFVTQYNLEKMGLVNKVVEAGKMEPNGIIYAGFSPAIPESKEYAEILTKGMIELKKSGELNKIFNKYNLNASNMIQ